MLFWIIDLKLLKIGIAIEELLMVGDAIVLDPIVGPNKAIGKPAHVSLPVADKEVEIVRPIARGSWGFACYCTGSCELQDAQPVNQPQFHGLKQMAIIALPTLPILQMMRLGLRRQLAFSLPPHHAGPATFECCHDRRNPLLSSTQQAPHSPHLASHAFEETHSKQKFPRRSAAGHGQSTIREFPHPIRLAAFAPQAHRNSRREISCNARRSGSDPRHLKNNPTAICRRRLAESCPAFEQNK